MTQEELTANIFACMCCDQTGLPFNRTASGKFYRFPPIIGATGKAALLFVGINPRISDTNKQLHNAIMNDSTKFTELSKNQVGKNEYIGTNGLERHYSLHVKVAQALFPTKTFDSVASVTELYFCASESSQGLPYNSSPCAKRYFRSVLEIASPLIVFAVGKHVERTLKTLFRVETKEIIVKWSTGVAPVIVLPHPNSFGPRNAKVHEAIELAKKHLRDTASD